MIKLNAEYIKNNYKIINKIQDNVYLVNVDNKQYILKKMAINFNDKTINEQHKYIDFLYLNGIKTAKIITSYKDNNDIYELQEYIENDNNIIDLKSLIIFIAKYHNISYKYPHNLPKNNTYNIKFNCNGFKLHKLLLGFNEKYYEYPIINLKKNINLINNNNKKYIDKLLTIYSYCYEYFISNYNISNCIIHNDITSNNVILSNNELYLIDFDLSISSSIYVDFIDCIIKRYKTIKELQKNLINIKSDIIKYIKIYNDYNKTQKIDYIGVICIFILKILSFNFYVLLNKKNKESFNNNLPDLTILINEIYKLFMEEL